MPITVLLTSGNVGIGTTTPTVKLSVTGANPKILISDDNGAPNINMGDTGSGNAAYLQMFKAGVETVHITTDAAASGSNTFFNAGNVGIGTTTPAYKLQVNGTIATDLGNNGVVRVLGNYSSDVASSMLMSYRNDIGELVVQGPNATTKPGFEILLSESDGGGIIRPISILNTGNVGIGDTTPTEGKLTIYQDTDPGTTPAGLDITLPSISAGTAVPQYGLKVTAAGYNNSNPLYGIYSKTTQGISNTSYGIYGENTGGAQNSSYGIYGKSNQTDTNGAGIAYGIYGIATSSGANGTGKTYAGYFDNQSATGATAVGLYVKSTTGATANYSAIFEGGNVGIGTTGPGAKLHISDVAGGNGRMFISDVDIAHGMTDIAPTDVFGALTANSGTGGLAIQGLSSAAGAQGLNLFGVIGNADPTDTVPAIAISGAKKNVASWQNLGDSETVLQVQNNGNALVTVLGSGNVGIGTTVPGSLLDVSSSVTPATITPTTMRISGLGTSAGWDTTTTWGNLDFYNNDTVGVAARIGARMQDGAGSAGTLVFSTGNAGTVSPVMTLTYDGNVGIGTTTPQEKLSVASRILATNFRTQPASNGAVDAPAYSFTDDTDIGMYRAGTDILRFSTAGADRVTIDATGNVGIGTTNPNEGKLEVMGGSVCVDTNSDGTASSCIASESDERLKTNIETLNASSSLDTILALRGVSFDWRVNDQDVLKHYPLIARFASSTHSVGLIAQEVQPLFPYAIGQETVGDSEVQYLQLDYTKFIPLIVQAVKELYAKIEDIAGKVVAIIDRLNGQDEKIIALEDRIAYLEAQLGASGASGVGGAGAASQDASDTEAPVITVQGNSPATISVGDTYGDLGALVSDNRDNNLGIEGSVDGGAWGDISAIVVDTSAAGEHIVTYRATDQAGNVGTATRTVDVVSVAGAPRIAGGKPENTETREFWVRQTRDTPHLQRMRGDTPLCSFFSTGCINNRMV